MHELSTLAVAITITDIFAMAVAIAITVAVTISVTAALAIAVNIPCEDRPHTYTRKHLTDVSRTLRGRRVCSSTRLRAERKSCIFLTWFLICLCFSRIISSSSPLAAFEEQKCQARESLEGRT